MISRTVALPDLSGGDQLADLPQTPLERLARARRWDQEVKALKQRQNRDLARIVYLLAKLEEERAYLELGFGCLYDYAFDRLSWGYSKVRDLTALARRLPRMPLLRAAFEAGELDWTKAVVAGRRIDKAPHEEAHWVEQARRKNARQLEQQASEGEDPHRRWSFDLSLEDEAWLREGFRALQSEGLKLPPGAAVAELIRRALRGGQAGSKVHRVLLDFSLESGVTTIPSAVGDVVVSEAEAARILCDAEVQDPSGRVKRTTPTRVKNKIRRRSKGRCEVPGCRNRAHLEFHHNRGWRRGHDPDFMLHLCGLHHTAIHEGRLRIYGSWSKGLTFCLADGSMLGRAGGVELVTGTLGEGSDDEEPGVAGGSAADADAEAVARATARGSVASEWAGDAVARATASGTIAFEGAGRQSNRQTVFQALMGLGLKQPEASELLERVLAADATLRDAPVQELLRSALCAIPVPRGRVER